VNASTENGKFATKEFTVTVGCFNEATLSPNYDVLPPMSGGFIPLLLPPYNPDNPHDQQIYNEVISHKTFQADVPHCFASHISICADVDCSSLIQSSGGLTIPENPVHKDEYGFHDLNIEVDRSSSNLELEFFIFGSTLDPLVNSTQQVKMAICGPRFTYTASDPYGDLIIHQAIPSSTDNRTVDILPMFQFAVPSADFPDSACIFEVTLCDSTTCGLD
jgi:hypothetical protein